jgi:hypothetical protein
MDSPTTVESPAWLVRSGDEGRCVEAWSDFRLPFECRPHQRPYLAALRNAIAGLGGRPARAIEAVYECASLPPGCDVENVLFYNVGPGSFASLKLDALVFRYRPTCPGPAPDGRQYAHHVRYALHLAEPGFDTENLKAKGSVRLAHIPLDRAGGSLKPWEVWLAVQRWADRLPTTQGSSLHATGQFALDVELQLRVGQPLGVFGVLKPLLDGLIASFHCAPAIDSELIRRVAMQTGESEDRLRTWFERAGPVIVATTSPVYGRGNSVGWHPDDSRMRYCRVRLTRGTVSTAELSTSVYLLS